MATVHSCVRPLNVLLTAIVVAASLLVVVAPARAATALYVAQNHPQCSDSGPGAATRPFCTIGRAADIATAGQTVVVSAGTYVEEVQPANSGTAAAPITYQAATGEDVVVTGANRGFTVRSRSWINISGFHITDTVDSGIYLKSASNVTLTGNRVSFVGEPVSGLTSQGIYVISTKNALLVGNTTDQNSDAGIYVATGNSGVVIQGNTSFANARGYSRAATGIDVRSAGTTVVGNWSYGNEDSGIQLYNGAHGTRVYGNLTYGNGDHGIDVLNSTDTVIVSNTVYDNKTAGINLEGASGTPASTRGTLRNNISVDNGLTSTSTRGNVRVDARSVSGTTLDRDLVNLRSSGTMITWGTTQYSSLAVFRAATGQETQGLTADPQWVAPAAGDFHLRSGSPAIDSADSAAPSQPAADIEGSARVDDPATPDTGVGPRTFDDRGAYEHKPVPVAKLTVTPSTGLAPLDVSADASASSSPIGIATYSFDFGDGSPGTGPQASPVTSHTYAQPGTYSLAVTVIDVDGQSSTATSPVRSTTPDEPPTPALVIRPSSGFAPLNVVADASASTDEGAIQSYTFDFGDGVVVGPQASPTAAHTYPAPGAFTVTVTVSDTGGQSSTASAPVTATDGNLVGNPGFENTTTGWNTGGRAGITLSRVAGGRTGDWSAQVTNTTATTSSDCTLNDAPNWVAASESGTYRASLWVRSDTPGQIVKLRLREYSAGTLVASSPVVSAAVGSAWQQLTVDLVPQVAGSTLDLTAYVSNAPPGTCFGADDASITRVTVPAASMSVTPSSGRAPLDVTADASGSSSPIGISTYSFDFGDGTAGTGQQTSPVSAHTYAQPGTYTLSVIVTDLDGQSSTASVTVTATDGNLVLNPGFESNTTGWNTGGRAGITLSRVAGGRTGGWSAQVTNTNATTSPDCTLNDAPNWVAASESGTYRASLWVRSDTPGQIVKLRLREYSAGTLVSSSPVVSDAVGSAWQQLTVDLVPQVAGSTLDLTAYVSNAPPGACFGADDIYITLT